MKTRSRTLSSVALAALSVAVAAAACSADNKPPNLGSGAGGTNGPTGATGGSSDGATEGTSQGSSAGTTGTNPNAPDGPEAPGREGAAATACSRSAAGFGLLGFVPGLGDAPVEGYSFNTAWSYESNVGEPTSRPPLAVYFSSLTPTSATLSFGATDVGAPSGTVRFLPSLEEVVHNLAVTVGPAVEPYASEVVIPRTVARVVVTLGTAPHLKSIELSGFEGRFMVDGPCDRIAGELVLFVADSPANMNESLLLKTSPNSEESLPNLLARSNFERVNLDVSGNEGEEIWAFRVPFSPNAGAGVYLPNFTPPTTQ